MFSLLAEGRPFAVGITIFNFIQTDWTLSCFLQLTLCVGNIVLQVLLRQMLVTYPLVLVIFLAPPFHLIIWLLQIVSPASHLPQWLSLSLGGYLNFYRSWFAMAQPPPTANAYIWDDHPSRTQPEITSHYVYQPLQGFTNGTFHFRLLELLPSPDFWAPIQARLQQGPFNQSQPYEAISYCWGDAIDTWPIYLENKFLPIRINLFQALRRFRFQSGSRFIWVDAICIDQSNSTERSYQVAMMRAIYQHSQCTLIWLGPGTPATTGALEFVRGLLRIKSHLNDDESIATLSSASDSELAKYGLNSSNPQLHAYQLLETNPWFKRVWVIQEVALSLKASVTLGSCTVDWDDYCDARAFSIKINISPSSGSGDSIGDDLGLARSLVLQQSFVTHRLLPLILRFRHHEATDPRDKIFALYGLFRPSPYADLLIPNYNIPTALLYWKAARCMLTQDKSLDILGIPRRKSSATLLLPSWIPIWTKANGDDPISIPLRPEIILSEVPETLDGFCASGSTKYEIRISSDQTLLGVDGVLLGTLITLGIVWPKFSDVGQPLPERTKQIPTKYNSTAWVKQFPMFFNALHNWREIARPDLELRYGETGQTRYEAFWQTIIGGNFVLAFEGKNAVLLSFQSWERNLQAKKRYEWLWPVLINLSRFSSSIIQIPIVEILIWPLLPVLNPLARIVVRLFARWSDEVFPGKRDSHNLFRMAMSVTIGRRLAILEGDYIALVPGQAMLGDNIFLLKGGAAPIVLRKQGKNWEVVGEAYMPGVMHGELWEEGRCEPMWLA
ncbi:hypothetical protein VTL71DRAFT_8691 [Oculimacula yallundae]|uniref:Heterokaryon incompatibility domain-containing protein n=1 Tax=Oculimacula yallundae TaxID=86028 RepID=A0ABR4D0K0_9HELO